MSSVLDGKRRENLKPDNNGEWLIGSITKVLADYVLLQRGIEHDKSVLEDLHEL